MLTYIMYIVFFLECDEKDPSCSTDKLSLEAINELHHMIDDDQDGNVNQQESKGVCSYCLTGMGVGEGRGHVEVIKK